MMTEIRLRSRVAPETLEAQKGKILTPNDYDILIDGAAKVLKPDGKPLAIYLPGALSEPLLDSSYGTLHALKSMETDNRGLASGTQRVKYNEDSTRSRSKLVSSAIIGGFEATPRFQYCRLTAWSGKENDKFKDLFPMFSAIGNLFAEHVPDRFAVQMGKVNATHPDWRIGDTPFTTITVNNTYPTGVHTDAGDLEEGFSTLAVIRRGRYTGGNLVFPEYRIAVDMKHGDVLLMDAHEWHGNVGLTDLTPECWWCRLRAVMVVEAANSRGKFQTIPVCKEHLDQARGSLKPGSEQPVEPMERISVVSYFRTKFTDCGSAEEEAAKAALNAEKKSGNIVDEMAAEAVGTAG